MQCRNVSKTMGGGEVKGKDDWRVGEQMQEIQKGGKHLGIREVKSES